MLIKIITILLIITAFLHLKPILAQVNLAQSLKGKILLQVESHGEAWYLNPGDYKRYFLGRPSDALELMRYFGIGITDENLNKFSIGVINEGIDSDNDGLPDSLENALNTDPINPDSDNDGYNDKLEIDSNNNPLGIGVLNIDKEFSENNLGKIFLQTEKNGEAWYINPANQKRYYLGRPLDAFRAMKFLSLGITTNNLNSISTGIIYSQTTPVNNPQPATSSVISNVANAIRSGNKSTVLSYFTESMQKAIEYTMDFLSADSRLVLANILSGANLTSSTADQKIYKNEVYFQGEKIPVYFYVKKQADGAWLLSNL